MSKLDKNDNLDGKATTQILKANGIKRGRIEFPDDSDLGTDEGRVHYYFISHLQPVFIADTDENIACGFRLRLINARANQLLKDCGSSDLLQRLENGATVCLLEFLRTIFIEEDVVEEYAKALNSLKALALGVNPKTVPIFNYFYFTKTTDWQDRLVYGLKTRDPLGLETRSSVMRKEGHQNYSSLEVFSRLQFDSKGNIIGLHGMMPPIDIEQRSAISDKREENAGHEAGVILNSINKLLPHINKHDGVKCIVQGSLAYAQLFMSRRDMSTNVVGLLPQPKDIPVELWIEKCAGIAWEIAVARETSGLVVKEGDRTLAAAEILGVVERDQALPFPGIATVALNPPQIGQKVFLDIQPNLIYDPNEEIQQRYTALSWDLTRWMLAAMSNCYKWSSKGAGLAGGMDMLQGKDGVTGWDTVDDFKRICVSVRQVKNGHALSIYNGCYSLPGSVAQWHNGSSGVLDSLRRRLPLQMNKDNIKNYNFGKITFEDHIKSIVEEEEGWVAEIRLIKGIFTGGSTKERKSP